MPDTFKFVSLRTRRARRGAAMLLVAVWAMLWLSQAYAACCEPQGGRHHPAVSPVTGIHVIVQSEHEVCSGPEDSPCPRLLAEKFAISSALLVNVADDKLAQSVQRQAPPMPMGLPRTGNDLGPEPPEPPGRIYLRLQRFLI